MEIRLPRPLARNAASLLRHTCAHDADEHAHNLSCWNQTYDQLSAGAFVGSVTELWLPKTQIFVETANQTLRQSCAAWPDSIWFGIPAPRTGLMTLGGRQISAESVCVRQNGADFDLLTAPDFNLFGIVVDRESFGRYLETVEHHNLDRLLGTADVLQLPLALKARVCADLDHILADAGAERDASELLQERIFTTLAQMLGAAGGSQDDCAVRGGLTRRQRQRTIALIREYLLAHPDAPISVSELCQRFHLSRRALQNCFEDVTGLSPLAYMRAIRLNGVRRHLRERPCSVGEAAYAWGFNHLSQFAQDYRKLFGELPSQTACRNT
jgi:AraC family transcriptional regulator, ethanolamine operon transcriptional activator